MNNKKSKSKSKSNNEKFIGICVYTYETNTNVNYAIYTYNKKYHKIMNDINNTFNDLINKLSDVKCYYAIKYCKIINKSSLDIICDNLNNISNYAVAIDNLDYFYSFIDPNKNAKYDFVGLLTRDDYDGQMCPSIIDLQISSLFSWEIEDESLLKDIEKNIHLLQSIDSIQHISKLCSSLYLKYIPVLHKK